MSKIASSASKIVFIMLATTACVAFLWGKLEEKDFMVIVMSASSFYFSSKGEQNEPYAGK